ncbi:hypothetical protein pb186bvf_006888 [Paramecium bursaria]
MEQKQTTLQKTIYFIFVWILVPFSYFGLSMIYYSTLMAFWSLDCFLTFLTKYTQCNEKSIFHQLKKTIAHHYPKQEIFAKSTDIITQKGYHFENHQITTDDGYIIAAWRIYKDPSHKALHPIVLQHGLLDCSWSWFMNNSTKMCLPYILADLGYDVWCTNNRGNKYSIGHKDLRNSDYNPQYWDYTLDHLVKYDIKAIIHHIILITQREQVIYIGHSQGCTQMFAHLSNDVTFQKHLKCLIGLGPAIYVSRIRSKLIKFTVKSKIFEWLDYIGIPYFFTFDDKFNVKIGALCDMIPSVVRCILFWVTEQLCGYSQRNKIDLEKFGFMVAHEPGGCSVKNLLQWMQIFECKELRYFNYGKDNQKIYGTPQPPKYPVENLKHLTIPKYLYMGTKDVITDEEDFNKMIKLFDQHSLKVIKIEDYAHLDYIWSVDAFEKLYPKIVKDIQENQK